MNDPMQDAGLGVDYEPAGRPLIPGQDATPHEGKDLRWVSWYFTAIIVGFGLAAIFWLVR